MKLIQKSVDLTWTEQGAYPQIQSDTVYKVD